MRDRMERLVILPFSAGCISEASVAVGIPQPRRSRPETNLPAITKVVASESLCGESMKNPIPKSNISTGLNRLLKGFKNLSQIFVEKEELEEVEMEMEIGCPTDVQHVTHIGCDGTATATNNPIRGRGWDNLLPPDNHLSLSNSLSLHQLQPFPSP